MMKRLLTYISIGVIAAACAKDDFDGRDGIDAIEEGAVRMSIAVPRDATTGGYDPLSECKVRVYKYTDGATKEAAASNDGTADAMREKELIRLYKSVDEIPSQLKLLAGDYCVTVEAGDKAAVSTVGKSYAGLEDFTVEAGMVESVTVNCKMLNAVVKVVFDATVREKLPDNAYSFICISDEWDLRRVENDEVPYLRFEEDGTGYFLLPAGASTLCWFFHGEGAELGTVEKNGKIGNVGAAMGYTLTFKYSKDMGGSLSFEVEVDENPEIVDDTIAFSPDPTIKGKGFDPSVGQNYIDGEYTFEISALAAVSEITLSLDGAAYGLLGAEREGVTVVCTDEKHYSVIVDGALFAPLYGGAHELTFDVRDVDGGKGSCTTVFTTQGIMPLTDGDYDLWYNTADFKASVLDPAADDVKIGYRVAGGEWTMLAATRSASRPNVYTARAADFAAGRNYEYRLFIDASEKGAQATVSTPAGTQVPNADLEGWNKSGNAYYPYAENDTPFWGTGNPASTLLSASSNLTTPDEDVRPNSTGRYSAKMQSTAVVGKFAAGNLFTGVFAGISGTNGLVDFGQPYTFTARPKALKFWYKANCGTINKTGNFSASGPDLSKIFIALCKWNGPHRVDTRDTNTFFDPRTADGIVAYSYFESTVSCPDWTEKVMELTYNSDEKPNYLVIVFTSSGYGDYFTGSTDSWMYADDIELIY